MKNLTLQGGQKTMKYQIRLILENGNYIVLDDKKELEYLNYMMKWYQAHKDFYNGTFEIVECK